MRILVTGRAGFIGSHIVDELIAGELIASDPAAQRRLPRPK